ncbi:MAG: TolC family protein, partial [Planctomycetes bacterium]|nr:TolC family protein [Planctomycetota bacterium]
EASKDAADLSNELYARGLAAFLNVLESQRSLYATQDQLVQSDTAVVTNLISLYKALGGGWDAPVD